MIQSFFNSARCLGEPCRTPSLKFARCASALRTCWFAFDEAGKQRRIAELEELGSNPSLWDDPDRAQTTLKQLSDLTAELAPWRELRDELEEAVGLLDLAAEEDDDEVAADVVSRLAEWRDRLGKLEFQLTLSGPYDRGNA